MNASETIRSILKESGTPLNDVSTNLKNQKNWTSPQELKKKWRKQETTRAILLLFASHLISYGLFFPSNNEKKIIQPVEKNHILIQLQGKSLLKNLSPGKTPVSLFNEDGRFLSHAYTNNGSAISSLKEYQHILLEIPSSQLPKILKWKNKGITVTPKTNKILKKKEVKIYEVDF